MIGDNDLAIPEKMMDLYAAQQRITAHNTANAGVKDYHKLHVSFSAELREAIASGDPEKIRNVQLHVEKARQPGVDTEIGSRRRREERAQLQRFRRNCGLSPSDAAHGRDFQVTPSEGESDAR